MWILTPLEPGGETHYLVSSKEYVVGRKNCDILLPNDQSISRAHARLTATDQTLTLKDTSKYGSFVNDQRILENTPVSLTSGDKVTFGVFQSNFSVQHQKPVVCSSCLDNDGKASLSLALLALGGKMVPSWTQDCTHLSMPSVKVTIKTISALLCCRPIVKPEFFSELSKAAQTKQPPPKAESFIPEIDEPSLSKEDVNLGAIPVRKQLFTSKTFVFLSAKQLKRLTAAVSFGGGRSQLLEEGSLPRDLLESPQSCVIDLTTGSTQSLLPSTAAEWASSVKKIVQRKGLRVITESEIGLAAIYASCDKYCNPSCLTPDSESAPKVGPRIPSASLSQSVAVDETVLPAASQNITAYAVNTEPSQGTALSEVTGLMAVGETPEKKQNQTGRRLCGLKPAAQKTEYIVADTMRSSFNTVENTDSQRKRPESKLTVSGSGSSGIRSQPSLPRNDSGMKTFFQKQSPQKQKTAAQASPQKQSTLTSFFQTVNKKRPLEDELSDVMSEPKRPLLESSMSMKAPKTSAMSKETYSRSDRVPAASPLGSAADLFAGRSEAHSDRLSNTVQDESRSRKRKEMEEEIQIEELESLMSEDMDFDEPISSNQGQPAQLKMSNTIEHKQGSNSVEALSKRQRVHQEENVKNQRPEGCLEKATGSFKNQNSEQHIVSIKTEPGNHQEYRTTNPEARKQPEVSSASKGKKNIEPFEDEEEGFIDDLELLEAETHKPKEEIRTPLKPVTVKQEVQETKIDEDLPKKLVLVEFRSLTVTVPPKTQPQRMQNGCAKNFKRFRKHGVTGAEDSPHIIRGSDLLVHNRCKNIDLDEWLKDAAEEERQSRQDETVGDDLFRYNPSKLTRRR